MMKRFGLFLFAVAVMATGCAGGGAGKAGGADGFKPVPEFGPGIAEVSTKYGTVAGYKWDGLYIYKGIPYAKAERFMPPQAPDSWEGVRSTKAYGNTAMQAHHEISHDEDEFAYQWTDGYFGEDCQRINVWTPGINDGKKRPVLFWIHGGGYSAGSGQQLPAYDGSNLAKEGDVVVCTINHRLNILGFLDLSSFGEKYRYSGNVGLMDIVAALQWVHDNIASFGGDPGNVTIMGQSGGGAKVSHLLVMPSAKGLFHKACVQSGSALSSGDAASSARKGEAFVKASGMSVEQLSSVSYEELCAIEEKAALSLGMQPNMMSGGHASLGLGPHVDGEVIPEQIADALAAGASKDIPMVIGTNLNEFLVNAYDRSRDGMTLDEAKAALKEAYGDRADEFVALYEEAFPDYEPRDLLETDFVWARPGAVAQAEAKAAQGGAPVYVYLFKYKSPAQGGIFRCPHNMELAFFFDNVAEQYGFTGGTREGQALGHWMAESRLNFAKTGVPSSSGFPEWTPFTAENHATLFMDVKPSMRENHDTELLRLVAENQ